MDKVICDKCGYEVCYNDGIGYEVLYLKCPVCDEIVVDKSIEELKMIE